MWAFIILDILESTMPINNDIYTLVVDQNSLLRILSMPLWYALALKSVW